LTECCTPRDSTLFPGTQIHVNGCLAGHAGLTYHGSLPPKTRMPIAEIEAREAAAFRHPARYRRPKHNCAGYPSTCPSKGCRTCLM
jgi:hypothetical protein